MTKSQARGLASMFTAIYLAMLYSMSADVHFILILSSINAGLGLFHFYNDKEVK